MRSNWDIARFLTGLIRVRSLYTALCDGEGLTDGQRAEYLRCLQILDKKIASAEMRLSLGRFVRHVRQSRHVRSGTL
jgi:hypothetical protein